MGSFFKIPSSSLSAPSKSPKSRASVAGLQETRIILSAPLSFTASTTERSMPLRGGSHTITLRSPSVRSNTPASSSSTLPQILVILPERPFMSRSSSAHMLASFTTSMPYAALQARASRAVSMPPPLYRSIATAPPSAASLTISPYSSVRTPSLTCKKVFAPARNFMPISSPSKKPSPKTVRHSPPKMPLPCDLFMFKSRVISPSSFLSISARGEQFTAFAATRATIYLPPTSLTATRRISPHLLSSS